MYQVLHGLDFSYVCIDDVLVTSCTPEEHKLHLRMILERFQLYGILINPTKCAMYGWTAVPETPHQPARSVPTWGPSTGHARVSKTYNRTSTMGVPWHSELLSLICSSVCSNPDPTQLNAQNNPIKQWCLTVDFRRYCCLLRYKGIPWLILLSWFIQNQMLQWS